MLATELLDILGPDHAGPVPGPGLRHLPHLPPGQGGGVKHENAGVVEVVVTIDASCLKLQLTINHVASISCLI